MRGAWTWRRLVAGAGVLTLVAATAVAAGPAGAAVAGPATAARPGPDERSVTLITGDRVLVGAGGAALRPVPGPGREHIRFILRRFDGHGYVVPRDALPMLSAGRLDWRLFDVTGLIEAGYDDARRSDLPLLLRTPGGAAARAGDPSAGGVPAGARPTRRLSTLDLTAVRAGKDTRFWSEINKIPATRVWLDGVRRPLIDRSVPHIGAPAAWAAGYTGAGVTVAVLDSGINVNHPDLIDRVVAARNFTEEGEGDLVGHGTHVAGTIAGTGAASDGAYRGVAPDARLLDAKVCGFLCTESSILAGMEWAAVEHAATIVNMSLGGADQPGLDPLEDAVNRLTESHGTLFVIAAGNVGRCSLQDRVASPGSADAALTVGATTLADDLAGFSCRGPTLDTGTLKPDITAPGVDIVSARAPFTPVGDGDPVGRHYARSSGTSMSAPHVAGAAALLAQRHPDWRADRLKATLMASAVSNPALTAYQQGAGRVDVARAINQAVAADPPGLSLGRQRWPHTDDEPVVRALSYRNDGPADVTLTLRLAMTGPDGRPAPERMFGLSATALTVPAGGHASVTVTADTRVSGPDGHYTGRLVATGDGGTDAVVVGTPVAVDREVESYDVTVRALNRTGTPTDQWVGDILVPGRPVLFEGGGTIRVPRGGYELVAFVYTPGEPEPFGSLSLIATRIELTADTVVTFDARRAKPVEVTPPREGAGLAAGMVAAVGVVHGYSYTIGLITRDSYQGLFSVHQGASSDRTRLSSYVWGGWGDPGPAGDYGNSPYAYNLAWFSPGRMYDGFFRRPRDRDLAAVRSTYPSPEGRLTTRYDFARQAGVAGVETIAVQFIFLPPTTRTEYYTTEGVQWRTEMVRYGPFGFDTAQGATYRSFRRGTSEERWGVGVLGPALPEPYNGEIWVRQFPETLVFGVPMHSDADPTHFADVRPDSARTVLYRDGVQVAESTEPGYVVYPAPAAAADIRVETTTTQSVHDTSTEIRASWRFRTRPVADGDDGAPLPVMAVRFAPELDAANSAPGGRARLLPVTVERHPGAPDARVTSLTVDVSYDDGATWRRVPLARTPHGWLGLLLDPADGYVSLRARAVDARGDSVEQTIIRGYRLR
jgi:subtilisin family serine protease